LEEDIIAEDSLKENSLFFIIFTSSETVVIVCGDVFKEFDFIDDIGKKSFDIKHSYFDIL
jgi:hypothetical protein